MKRSTSILTAILAINSPAFAANPWHTGLPIALDKARAENKAVFVNFTGSDWCGYCIQLKREILVTPAFESFASNNLVLVEVDFPKRKAITAAQRQANNALQHRFNIQGYPTLVILDASGRERGRMGYEPGGPKPFLTRLQTITGAIRGQALKTVEGRGSSAPAAPEQAKWLPVTTPPPPPISNLVLKGVSGSSGRRVALINDRSLTAGEGAVIQLADRRVKVRCLKVGDKSVVVKVDNHPEPVELKLREGL